MNKKIKKFQYKIILIAIFCLSLLIPGCAMEDEEVLFVTTGHIYPLLGIDHPPEITSNLGYNDMEGKTIKKLIDDININYRNAKYAFFLGDVVRKNEEKRWKWLSENLIKKIKIESLFVPGNHGYRLLETQDEWGENFRKIFFPEYFKKMVLEKANKKFLFLMINTTPIYECYTEYCAQGTLDKRTQDFLMEELKKSDEFDYVFIMMHHALWGYDYFEKNYDKKIHPGVVHYNLGRVNEWDEKIVPILDNNKTYVFMGDSPMVNHFVYKDVNYLMSGFNFTDSPKTANYMVVKYSKIDNKLYFYRKSLENGETQIIPISLSKKI